MRKETINTFTDGMSLDLNPLGTPAKTLTNCLNGTLVTYNGNELTLQNDMGNTEVGTAYLPKGYVPVGMKEYGGIIYVASYNPKTNKGQLGCFPSPQQIYTSEVAQTVFNLNIQDKFVNFTSEGLPIIELGEYKEEIFKDAITQEARIFTSGDAFLIKTDNRISELLRQAIDESIIAIKLFVIPSDGSGIIDISSCEYSYLRLYNEISQEHIPLWIFQNTGDVYEGIDEKLGFQNILKDYREYLQVFPPNISKGTLEIVVEFNMFKTFNLYKNISKGSDYYNVQLIGRADPDNSDPCHPVSEVSLNPLLLVGHFDYDGHVQHKDFKEIQQWSSPVILEAKTDTKQLHQNKTLYYDVIPGSEWGAFCDKESFLKYGQLSYDDIQNNQDKITSWNFEVNSTELILKWSFLHIEDPQNIIDHLRFVCIPFDQVLDNDDNGKTKEQLNQMFITTNVTENSQYIYKIEKPYYSGDFEDIFKIDEEHLQMSYIYLCRLDVIYTDGRVKNGIDYKILYTGTFFNDKDTQLFSYNNRPQVTIKAKINVNTETDLLNYDYTKIQKNKTGIVESHTEEPSANDVMFLGNNDIYLNSLVGLIINAEYETKNTLQMLPEQKVVYNDTTYNMFPTFAGMIEGDRMLDNFSENGVLEFQASSNTEFLYDNEGDDEIEDYKKKYIEPEEINDVNINENPTISFTKDEHGNFVNNSKIKVHRGILARLGKAKDWNVVHQGLFPVYDEEDPAYNEQLLGFTLHENDDIDGCIAVGEYGFTAYSTGILADHPGISNYEGEIFEFSTNASTQANTRLIDVGDTVVNSWKNFTQKHLNKKPINLCISTEKQDFKYLPFLSVIPYTYLNSLTMPHDLCFRTDMTNGDACSNHDDCFGDFAKSYNSNILHIPEYGLPEGFHCPQYTENVIAVLWQTQYGPRIINIATPLDIKTQNTYDYLTYIKPSIINSQLFEVVQTGKKYSLNNMHLRAEKLLICLLSQILITKCRNSTLVLNGPETLYSNDQPSNSFKLTLNKLDSVDLYINGKNIEKIINVTLQNEVLENSDIFIPQFKLTLSNIILQLKTRSSLLQQSQTLFSIFNGEDYPYFSTINDIQFENIYPGKIIKLKNQYLCELEKDEHGLYKIGNTQYNANGKIDRVFIPQLISEANKPGAEFSIHDP